MQKWCPKDLASATSTALHPVADDTSFETCDLGDKPGEPQARSFRREAGFSDTKSLMNSLTTDERAEVYELVEIDVMEEFKAREVALTQEFETRLAEAKVEHQEMFDVWTANIAGMLADEMKAAAAASSRLAIQIAEKIVRQVVAVDKGALTRVIETTLFSVASNAPLVVRANASDAAWLESQTGLAERLNIGRIVADRRIEPGGCLIQCEGREWDATLKGQLKTIGEAIATALATAEVTPESLFGAQMGEQTPPTDESGVSDGVPLD